MPIRGFVSPVFEAFFTVAFLAAVPVVSVVVEFDLLPVATAAFVSAPFELPVPPDTAPVLPVPLPGVPGFTASFFFRLSIALLSDATALSTFVWSSFAQALLLHLKAPVRMSSSCLLCNLPL